MKIKKIRHNAWRAQNGKCYYCDQPTWCRDSHVFAKKHDLTIKIARRFQVTAEHLCPKSNGGADEAGNIVAACLFCNGHRHRAKRPLSPENFALKVRSRLGKGKWHGFIASIGTLEIEKWGSPKLERPN